MANSGTMSVAPELEDIKGTGFDKSTDSLVKVRDELREIEGAGFATADDSLIKIRQRATTINDKTSYLTFTSGRVNSQVADAGVLNDLSMAEVTGLAAVIEDDIATFTPAILAVEQAVYPSDDLINSNDDAVSGSENVYTLKKKTFCGVSGILRIKFDLKSPQGGGSGNGKIYKNGETYGIEQEAVGTDWTTFSEDLAFVVGDTIEIWYSAQPECTYQGQNFRVCGIVYNDFTNLLT